MSDSFVTPWIVARGFFTTEPGKSKYDVSYSFLFFVDTLLQDEAISFCLLSF